MPKSKIMEEILEVLKKYETFLILSHVNPDGDALGSQLALYSLLSDLGKKALVVNSDPVPLAYRFLPNAGFFTQDIEHNTQFDVVLVLDCGNPDRTGAELAAKIHPKHALINIDHHRGNKRFGTLNLVDTRACATAELIFNIIESGNMEIGMDRAVCLYTGILTDTGSFKFSNTTAEAHRITARLIDEGVRPEQISESVYEVIPYQRAKLLGVALERLQLSEDGKIAWTSVTNAIYEQTGALSEDTEGIIDYIRSLRGVEVAVFLRELENGDFKVSLRSKGDLAVNVIASAFGGGGHRAAAGCTLSGSLEEVADKVFEALGSAM
jgi:phosphoesterase RecJ-like protein